MKLAIFDIDGTLTETNEVDSVCFVRGMSDAHAVGGMNTNWGDYAHTTDSYITREVLRDHLGRTPDEAELSKFKSRFVSLLEESRSADARLFGQVSGASAALARLKGEPGWTVAIATGCWRGSGLLKLSAAGLETSDVPAAFAEDGVSREEILLTALSRARECYGRESFEAVVSLGDGLWDVSAARNLGFSFVGVGRGARASMLREAGASHVIEDFNDYERLLRCLSEAKVPAARVNIPPPAHET
ncbi:MAG: haloacid dehalogenase-like hydrolase [Acidobacteria bacterium]|nr:haloacid dehalogenase-like hydrolase [Acidobacteriota bacterium]MCA1618411.1 haloacid dehalogenase-like hydrolase [Acidobacteriota bacterium]